MVGPEFSADSTREIYISILDTPWLRSTTTMYIRSGRVGGSSGDEMTYALLRFRVQAKARCSKLYCVGAAE
jgi:hypothetical protein